MAPPDQSRFARVRGGGPILLLVAGLLVILFLWGGGAEPSSVAPSGESASAREPVRTAVDGGGVRTAPATRPAEGSAEGGSEMEGEPSAPGAAARGTLHVRVVDDRGRPDPAAWAEPLVCPGFRMGPITSDLPRGALVYEAPLGRCLIGAVRMDGLVRTEGEPVQVTVEPGTTEVELPIPSTRTGTVHFAYAPEPEGIRLLWVPDDSNLAEAGLQRGDVILAVDGEPVEGRSLEELQEMLEGDEGSRVRILVQRAGSDTAVAPEELELEREIAGG